MRRRRSIDGLSGLMARARRFAALSGPFKPDAALDAAGVEQLGERALVASSLAQLCHTALAPDSGLWLMRSSERQHELEQVDDAALRREAEWRRSVIPPDDASQDLLQALTRSGTYAPEILSTRLSEIMTRVSEADRPWLTRVSDVLTWAGRRTPLKDALELVRAALARLDDAQKCAETARRPFAGRESDVATLTDWLASPVTMPPVRTLFVTGLPGMGKSTLLDRALIEAFPGRRRPLVVRLDFDRPSLDTLDATSLTAEVARQIGHQLPQLAPRLQRLRVQAARTDRGAPTKGERSGSPSIDLLSACGRLVQAENRPIVAVLDTLEVLRGRGESHPSLLFDWLDDLVRHGFAPLSVIAAGRGDALDATPHRVGQRHDLSSLTPEASEQVLEQFAVPVDARPAIQSLAKGNPLLLRVAAHIATTTRTSEDEAALPIEEAHLHRFLLSRLDSPELRALARSGLVVRWISPPLISEVIAPAVGVALSSPGEAMRLFSELERHTWLLRRQPGTDWLRQDAGMRAVLLPLLYAADPTTCAKLDRAAAAWFERQPEARWRAEGVYHRLQATRAGDPLPEIGPELASLFDAPTLAELPEAACDAVARGRGERSSAARGGRRRTAAAGAVDPRAIDDLRLMVEKSDWTEASLIYDQAIHLRNLDPAAPAADPVRSFLWRVGRWSEALRLLRDHDRGAPEDRDLPELHPIDALVRLEMRAEFMMPALMSQFARDGAFASAAARAVAGGASSDLRSGALGFGLAIARPDLAARSTLGEADLVGATLAMWGEGPRSLLAHALGVAADRREIYGLASPLLPPGELTQDDLAGLAGALTTLTPYARPIQLRVQLSDDGRLAAHAAAILGGMRALGAPLYEPLARLPRDPLTALQALSLTAEWAAAAGWVMENEDLRAIARRAELWRRTVSGRWSYFGQRPRRWRGFKGSRRLDATAMLQLQKLLAGTPDASVASRRLLALWTGEGGEANTAVFAPLVHAAELRFSRPGGAGELEDAAAKLGRSVPFAIALPAAILAAPSSSQVGVVAEHRRSSLSDRIFRHPIHAHQEGVPMGADVAVPQGSRSPFGRAYEESLARLQNNLLKPGGMGEAAAKLIKNDQFDLRSFGLNRDQVLEALSKRGRALEASMSPPALEAIVRRTGRPPLVVRNDAVVLQPLPDFPGDIDVKIRAAEASIPSVGRVEFVNQGMAWGGTGWVIDKKGSASIIATNRHVAKLVARRARDGSGVFLRSPVSGARYGAMVDFNEEAGARPDEARAVPVSEVTYLADDFSADVALLKVSAPSGSGFRMPDPLGLAAREAARGEIVALVGYPAYDARHDGSSAAIIAMANYFRDLYDVKRFAPGFLTRAFAEGVISHDCTSLGGNSGSPLLSLDQNAVVGLHFAGLYGVENSAVSVTTLKTLLKGETVVSVVRPGSEGEAEKADASHTAAELADRDGYDPSFLGKKFVVPWPILPDTILEELAAPSDATPDRPHELRYTHFSVKFSSEKRLPILTAVNIDGAKAVKIKRGSDQWFFDLRIPRSIQYGSKAYQDRQIDRGHLVRREDPNWGKKARQANDDTFHYTNSAPQHSDLNQGKALWQGLENYILDNARTHGFKACVFTGPVFSEDDPELDEGIRVPLEFWKVVVMIDADRKRLHATAYLLSQGQLIRKLLEDRRRTETVEGFVLSTYRTFQVSVGDLGSALGYDFGPLVAADPLARVRASQEASDHNQPVLVELADGSDLIL